MTAPLPRTAGEVLVACPGIGDGWWAGAPAVVADSAGGWLVAWRERHGHDGFDEVVVASSPDGVELAELLRLPAAAIAGARWIERPALVALPDGGWRLYVCVCRADSKRWTCHLLDAADVGGLAVADPVETLAIDAGWGTKDPIVVREGDRWRAWVCGHPVDRPGDEDRMRSWYAESDDGVRWHWLGPVLSGRSGSWDERGARITAVLPDGRALYDGRRDAAANWFERTGVAEPDPADPDGVRLLAAAAPSADIRYPTAARMGGGTRLYWEQRTAHGGHELRTELLPD